MAVIEFQIRKQAFLDYVKSEINHMRLPSPTIDIPFHDNLKGKMLERIECLNCTSEPTPGSGTVSVTANLAIHYHPSPATVKAAGSLQKPATQVDNFALPITVSINLNRKPDGSTAPKLQYVDTFGAMKPGQIPLSLGNDLKIQAASVESNEDLIAIRLGTDPNDPVSAPITNRLNNCDWSQFLPGQIFVDMITANFAEGVNASVENNIKLSKSASGTWLPFGNPLLGYSAPCMMSSAELTAEDECPVFNIDIDISLNLVGEFSVSGRYLTTTLTLAWSADAGLCEFAMGVLATPIASIVVDKVASDKASEKILGKATTPDQFKKIGQGDDYIQYRSTRFLDTPGASFVFTHAEMTLEGLVTTGNLTFFADPLGLRGSMSGMASALKPDCNTHRVDVVFNYAKVYLEDIGIGGPPRLFFDKNGVPSITFDPPNAWVPVITSSNSWLDLAITFFDPPTGRLPVGTPTSALIQTDCGVRWVDLGAIPAQHADPTEGDMAAMFSNCMAISDPWGMGVLNLDWLVDPAERYGDRVIDPVRQWSVAAKEMPEDTRIDFVAIGPDGQERPVGSVYGRRNFMVSVTTDAKETLQIRADHGFDAPPPQVFQRWIEPFASVPLSETPAALSAANGVVGLRGANGETHLIQFDSGEASLQPLSPVQAMAPGMDRLLQRLDREQQFQRESWSSAAHLDSGTVAVMHGGNLLIGSKGPAVQM